MKSKTALSLFIAAACGIGWFFWPGPQPTLLSVRIGNSFEEVIKESSYPVEKNSDSPHKDEHGFGATFVTKPAVIVKFDDPQYGFILPPTTFCAIAYLHGKVTNVRTSPSLRTLSLSEAISVFSSVQTQLQNGGWVLDNESRWIDLSTDGIKKLHDELNNGASSFTHIIAATAPAKYALYFGIRRAGDSLLGSDRYLIELSIGADYP